ncbi:MAG: lipocalin family protein [Candidatus Aminicenantes bacterium]|nr:lipocalin family protein [Candidatus Aminicenantes bacterium]
MKTLLFLLSISGILGLTGMAAAQDKPLETVPSVDLQKYLGRWYEISSFPQRFQKGCHCTVAEYSMEKDFVRVINTCRKDGPEGKESRAKGKAFVVKGSNNAKLRVQFFWPFRGDYWIIDLAEDYSFAVVGAPDRDYLWILSRTPQMDEGLYQEIVKRCADKGFDINRLVKTDQTCAGR